MPWPGQKNGLHAYKEITEAQLGIANLNLGNGAVSKDLIIPWGMEGWRNCSVLFQFDAGPLSNMPTDLLVVTPGTSDNEYPFLAANFLGINPVLNTGGLNHLLFAFDDGPLPGNMWFPDATVGSAPQSLAMNPVWFQGNWAFLKFNIDNDSGDVLIVRKLRFLLGS